MKSVARQAVAAGACLGLLTAGGYLALRADASDLAAAPAEVSVIPADPAASYTSDQVYVAGGTGFLHRYGTTTSPLLWTRYADGVTTAIPELATVDPSKLTPAGGDVVTTASTVPGHSVSGGLTVLDLSTMAWQQLSRPVPAEGGYLGYYGGAMVVQTGTAKLGLRRFAADGTSTTTAVTGIPADATSVVSAKVGDATSVVLHLVTGGALHYALLDLATAVVTLLPVQPISVRTVLLNADRVGFFGGPNGGVVVRSYARNALTDEPQVVSLPDAVSQYQVALAGSHVIASTGSTAVAPLIDYTAVTGAGGGTVVPLLQQGQGVVQGADRVLLVGGSGPADWSVRRMTGDGQVTTLLPLTGPLTNAGVTISQGLLRHVEAQQLPGDPATRYLLFNHKLAAGTDGIDPTTNGGTLTGALPCDAVVPCTRTVDGNGYGTTYLTANGTTASLLKTRVDVYTSTLSVPLPSTPGTIVDASNGYVVVNGTNPAQQYVIRTGYSDAPVAGPIGAAALWFETLWTSPKAGYLQAENLQTGKSATAVPIGAPCVATELQATGADVYWSCGPNGPAGVYDQTRKVSAPVPAGRSLLGDGYLVHHDSGTGELVRYDLATGTAATVATFARGSLADDRGINWSVDKFGGDIAYVDAANTVHVVDPGVAPAAPAAGIGGANSGYLTFSEYGTWSASYCLTRPVAAWTLTITQVSTGKVVATRTGGPIRVRIATSWDGYLADQKKAPSGHYKYTTTVTATAGATPVTIDSGTLLVDGGTPNLHSFESAGQPSILGVKANGEGHWLIATTGAALHDNGWTEDWHWGSASSQVNALVPFGDVDNDGRNDLIARSGTGYLRAYLGTGQSSFGGAKTVTIGSGWNQYNAIVTSGDLTGDGIADLLARDKDGKIWRYNGTGKKSFAARVALSGTYKSFTRLIGPGDINGDGRADLLVVSSAGDLSSAYGTGKGTFGALHKVSSGWTSYNVVISAGDLNEDGHPDLLARDTAGVLWRFLGTGTGTFAARQKVGTGYQQYTHLS